ncbi:response regulator [Acidobacteria bacterium AB60]|nr:response regulator [Acidobacteria bacterium AB60]
MGFERFDVSTHFPTVPVEAARQHPAALPSGPLRPLVLVVDDEPLIAQTLAAIMDSRGYAVLTASDGLEALEICALMPPELLIADVSMPVMNGFDLAIEVKRLAPDCEIIFFSGQPGVPGLCRELGEPGRDCVVLLKPVHPADLLEQAREVLRRRGRILQPTALSRTQSLYEFLSSVVRDEDVNPSAWSLTLRERQRDARNLG